MTNDRDQHPYFSLDPDTVMDALESLGLACNGRLFALNSYENRVYQVGIEDDSPLIAKFYRPGRWSDAQIQEEHDFCFELAEAEMPVICPIKLHNAQSLITSKGFRIALYPQQGGRAPELDQMDHIFTIAQNIGRLHQVGRTKTFSHRPALTLERFGYESQKACLDLGLPESLKEAYQSVTTHLLQKLEAQFSELSDVPRIRTHGDCHMGNILMRDDRLFFVDFDDTLTAPAIWDLWMLLSGTKDEQRAQLEEIIEGYETFSSFDTKWLRFIEPLRTLRMMAFTAWLSKRWDDPAFKLHFPWFNTERYWGEHILEMKAQLAMLDEPPLSILR